MANPSLDHIAIAAAEVGSTLEMMVVASVQDIQPISFAISIPIDTLCISKTQHSDNPPTIITTDVAPPHRLWKHAGQGGTLKYTSTNVWKGKGVKKSDVKREGIHGVEVRDLPPGHMLAGEQGLFATKRFEQFNIIGEYTGVVVPKTEGGKIMIIFLWLLTYLLSCDFSTRSLCSSTRR